MGLEVDGCGLFFAIGATGNRFGNLIRAMLVMGVAVICFHSVPLVVLLGLTASFTVDPRPFNRRIATFTFMRLVVATVFMAGNAVNDDCLAL